MNNSWGSLRAGHTLRLRLVLHRVEHVCSLTHEKYTGEFLYLSRMPDEEPGGVGGKLMEDTAILHTCRMYHYRKSPNLRPSPRQ